MPSKSDKQHRLMEAVKHNPKFAKKVGIPQSVGRDFIAADKRTGKYARGGGVLGKIAMRPLPDGRIPKIGSMLQTSDKVNSNAQKRLRKLGR